MTDKSIPKRAEVAIEHTWNAESVYPSRKEWDAELKAILDELPTIQKFQGKLNESPAIMVDALEKRDGLLNRIEVAMMYAHMSHAVDKTDSTTGEMPGKASAVYGQVRAAVSFLEPEIIALGQDTIHTLVRSNSRLAKYQHYLEDLFRKQAHVRSAEVEELLGRLIDPFSSVSTTAGMLADADFKFKPALTLDGQEIELTQGSYYRILANPDRRARQTSWENYQDLHYAYKNTLANNLATSIKQNVFLAHTRHHASTLEAVLYQNNIPTSVFQNLIDTFRKNLPIWHRYFEIRRQALGVERLEPYDMWAPLTRERPSISYQQAIDWICQGMSPLGEEFVSILRKGCLEDRWVDIYPNQGKSSGAFSYGAAGTYPFIVMNYTDNILSLSTLAHELGHSMHSYLTWQTQPYVYSDYSTFVAEVASNFNQAMVRAYLLEQIPDPDFQVSLIEEAMANFYRYFLIMPTLARFELETHQRAERGEGLSADWMIALMADLFQEAYGDHVHVDRERVGITWAEFRHLYSDYYVFQYATGISGANALARRILSGKSGAVEAYLNFLRSGSSLYPLETLQVAGVDLTKPQPVEETFQVMAGMVDMLPGLL